MKIFVIQHNKLVCRTPQNNIGTFGRQSHKNIVTIGRQSHNNIGTFGRQSHNNIGTFGRKSHMNIGTFGRQSHKNIGTIGKEIPLKGLGPMRGIVVFVVGRTNMPYLAISALPLLMYMPSCMGLLTFVPSILYIGASWTGVPFMLSTGVSSVVNHT